MDDFLSKPVSPELLRSKQWSGSPSPSRDLWVPPLVQTPKGPAYPAVVFLHVILGAPLERHIHVPGGYTPTDSVVLALLLAAGLVVVVIIVIVSAGVGAEDDLGTVVAKNRIVRRGLGHRLEHRHPPAPIPGEVLGR